MSDATGAPNPEPMCMICAAIKAGRWTNLHEVCRTLSMAAVLKAYGYLQVTLLAEADVAAGVSPIAGEAARGAREDAAREMLHARKLWCVSDALLAAMEAQTIRASIALDAQLGMKMPDAKCSTETTAPSAPHLRLLN